MTLRRSNQGHEKGGPSQQQLGFLFTLPQLVARQAEPVCVFHIAARPANLYSKTNSSYAGATLRRNAACMQAALRPKCGQLHLIARCNSRGRRPASRRRPRRKYAVNEHVQSRRIFQGVFFYL